MAAKDRVAPTKRVEKFGGDDQERFDHDAFGTISLTTQTGGAGVLFGSDINHNQCVSIKICRADLSRNLSNDWIHPSSMPIVEINMSHSQFAEFITGNGRASGTPCTLAYAPARGTPTEVMPGIEKLETKAETFRKEIRNSATEQMAKVMASVVEMEKMLEEGTISKKTLKALVFNMRCHVDNTPGNMAFVVEQAEEALEKAVTHARIEVEALIEHNVNRLGREAAKQIGLIRDDEIPVLMEGTKVSE